MVAAEPFSGQIVRADAVADVAAPAYDALTSAQRRQYRLDHPLCYLHVTRSAPDEDDPATVDNTTLVQRGRAALENLLEADVFAATAEPSWMVYELEIAGHRQRGLVCEVAGGEFRARAKPHEATQPARAALLAEHFTTVKAASSPVACTVADGEAIAQALSAAAIGDPIIDYDSGDGLTQRVWRVDDADVASRVQAALADADLYIIDGHHRAAANGHLLDRGLDVPLLVAIFPPESLQLIGFHRLVRPPTDLDEAGLIDRIARRFLTEPVSDPRSPERGTVLIRAASAWFRVRFDERPVSGSPHVRLGSLDPCIVEREIVRALVERGGDPADVTYMPDEVSIAEVASQAADDARVPILVPPLEVDDIIEVADSGLLMPAKSTYFTPKVRSGLFLRRYDDQIDATQ